METPDFQMQIPSTQIFGKVVVVVVVVDLGGAVVVVDLGGAVVVVDLGGEVVVAELSVDVVMILGTVVVADGGRVVLVDSLGAVVLVVPFVVGIVVVLVADGTTVVVELAGDVDGLLTTVPEFRDPLAPPDGFAAPVVDVMKVVLEVPEEPLLPPAGGPGFPPLGCDAALIAAPGTDTVRFAATATVVNAGWWYVT